MTNIPSVCEEATYTKIFKEYVKSLHNYLYYKTGNKAMSHDLAQEAFSKLWQNCAKVTMNGAKGYVFKTANNLLINEYNHQKVVLNYQTQPQQQKTIESPEFLLEEQEFKQKLEDTIAALPEKQRVVFLLSRIDKKTYKEIADIVGISRQAVEKRMYNALNTLREVVSQRIR